MMRNDDFTNFYQFVDEETLAIIRNDDLSKFFANDWYQVVVRRAKIICTGDAHQTNRFDVRRGPFHVVTEVINSNALEIMRQLVLQDLVTPTEIRKWIEKNGLNVVFCHAIVSVNPRFDDIPKQYEIPDAYTGKSIACNVLEYAIFKSLFESNDLNFRVLLGTCTVKYYETALICGFLEACRTENIDALRTIYPHIKYHTSCVQEGFIIAFKNLLPRTIAFLREKCGYRVLKKIHDGSRSKEECMKLSGIVVDIYGYDTESDDE